MAKLIDFANNYEESQALKKKKTEDREELLADISNVKKFGGANKVAKKGNFSGGGMMRAGKFVKENRFKNFTQVSNNPNSNRPECSRCGSTKHGSNYPECPARRAQCIQCEKVGHYKRKCKDKSTVNQVLMLTDDKVNESDMES